MTLPAEVLVAGTRTFSAEVADFAVEAGARVLGLVEPFDRERVGQAIHDLPVVSWLEDGPAGGVRAVLVGTGETGRRETVRRLLAAGWEPVALVHPRAHVARSATVGAGSVVGPGAIVGARAAVGDHVVIGRGSLVGHHTEIGEFATLGPGANLAGNVRVGPDVFVGMGAVVRDHVTLGAAATVAMGAVVVGDVEPGASVRGVPASPYEVS
jgi:sugar O-acyltransferase (sialic acid O-acetyltransferase NeuD family)